MWVLGGPPPGVVMGRGQSVRDTVGTCCAVARLMSPKLFPVAQLVHNPGNKELKLISIWVASKPPSMRGKEITLKPHNGTVGVRLDRFRCSTRHPSSPGSRDLGVIFRGGDPLKISHTASKASRRGLEVRGRCR
ncbi:hypothetical protein EVAR_78694_1 [Eumeta japonica]|uniref:Uncharacterized protein n=1 Tax=Eumeta variegata TaxID=151549 RepID=A0A4C2AC81_EUMVA|nr:hypothetical protein EVAR_78694_1 [Eumeta japonica]